jgi:2'-hydroxyisoflavone reductase
MPRRRDVLAMATAATVVAPLARAAAPPARKLKILILGGTGFIGPHQVRYALERGHTVTLFNRGRQPQTWPRPVEELLGDRNTGDLKALEGREWDVCIDNPTTLPFWVRDAGKVLAGKVKQYIFVSTISAYAANDKIEDETGALVAYDGDPLAVTPEIFRAKGLSLYGPMKAASEQEAKKQFGAGATVVRPGLIVGPGDETDRFTYWPVRLAKGGETAAPGDGKDPVMFIDARDLAEWIVRLAESQTTGTFNAIGPARALTMAEMLKGIGAAVHSTSTLTWIPEDFLDAQHVGAWIDMPVWVPAHGETAGFHRRRIDRALAAGLTFRPLATTAAQTLAWFRTQAPERQARLKAGLTAEREADLLAKWKAAPHPAR